MKCDTSHIFICKEEYLQFNFCFKVKKTILFSVGSATLPNFIFPLLWNVEANQRNKIFSNDDLGTIHSKEVNLCCVTNPLNTPCFKIQSTYHNQHNPVFPEHRGTHPVVVTSHILPNLLTYSTPCSTLIQISLSHLQ